MEDRNSIYKTLLNSPVAYDELINYYKSELAIRVHETNGLARASLLDDSLRPKALLMQGRCTELEEILSDMESIKFLYKESNI